MYIINEWFERYEVNEKCRPAKKGDALRKYPLCHIRAKVHGRRMSAGFARMQNLAGEKAYEVFGYFTKFLEIAADEKGGSRGALLTHKGEPAKAEDLAFDLRAPLEQVKNALEILANPQVAWLQIVKKNSRKFRKLRKTPGKFGINENENENENYNYNEKEVYIPIDVLDQPSRKNKKPIPKSSTSDFKSQSSSTRLDFSNQLRKILKPKSDADLTALWNMQRWADIQDDDIYRRIIKIAEDSKSGRKPIAVFFSRLEKELGYRPRAEADKRKG